MRMIGTISSDRDAERFSDYLVTQNIANMVEESQAGGAWSVWIEHDDDLDRGKSELDAFLKNAGDARYDAQESAQRIREEQQKKQKKRRAKFVDVRTSWSAGRQWAAPATIILIAASMVASLGTNSIGLGPPREQMLDHFRFLSHDSDRFQKWLAAHEELSDESAIVFQYWLSEMRSGQVWRIITPIFLHLSILHLLFNMFWLRDLGAMVESQRGMAVMIALVLISAIVSNMAEFLWELPRVPAFGGMSGVLYALFGYIWVKQRYEPHLGVGMSDQTRWIMLAWLFLCMTGMVGSVANAAHVAGLVVGAAFAYAPIAWRRMTRQLGS